MEQMELKQFLESLVEEIEANHYPTVNAIIDKLSLEMRTNILYKKVDES